MEGGQEYRWTELSKHPQNIQENIFYLPSMSKGARKPTHTDFLPDYVTASASPSFTTSWTAEKPVPCEVRKIISIQLTETETLTSDFIANVWLFPQTLQLTQSPEKKHQVKHFEGEKDQLAEWSICPLKVVAIFSICL